MAKYVIELDDEQVKLLNGFSNIPYAALVGWDEVLAAQDTIRKLEPLSMLDLQKEMMSLMDDQLKNNMQSTGKLESINFYGLDLKQKVKNWLLKNKAYVYRDPLADGHRIVINDNNGTKIMFISDEHIIDNPMDVVHKVTDLLKDAAFFQNWDDDDDEATKPNYTVKSTGSVLRGPSATTQSHTINGSGWALNPDGSYIIGSDYPQGQTHKVSKCFHEWKTYTGLNETFEYCTKCDEKKGNK